MKRTLKYAAIIAAALAGASAQVHAQGTLLGYWDFDTLASDGVSIANKVNGEVGAIAGSAILTDAGGGRPGAGGNKGLDVGANNPGWVQYENGDVLNAAADGDKMTVVLWQKNYSNINSSSFWGHSDSAGSGNRGFQFHIPWSDGTIYFDTQGCCGADTRLNKAGADFENWHHYAFVKDGGTKRIYIDGTLFAEASGYSALTADYSRYSIGAADNATPPDGIIDDFGVFRGALTEAEIQVLAGGARPDTIYLKDTDGDGLPDVWETQYGLNPNSNADKNTDPDNDGCDNTCEYKAGTNPTDTTPPTLASANATASFTTIELAFSEKLDPATAGNKANYSFSPALTISDVVAKGDKVTLTTATQTAGEAYVLTVNNLLDQSKNKIATDTKATVYSFVNLSGGILKFSYYDNIAGNAVQSLYDDQRYLDGTPTSVSAATAMDSRTVFANDSHETYGATIEGVFTAPESGDFDFFLRSDDGGDFWISTDDKPENASIVAFESGCCDAFKEPGTGDETTASPITLVKGKKYFMRLAYKEGGGGDYGQVAMRKTTDVTPAASLVPISAKDFTASAPANPQGSFLSVTPAANATAGPPNKVQVVHLDGRTALTAANSSLKVDGQTVAATFDKVGSVLTVNFTSDFAPSSTHNFEFTYADAAGNPATYAWSAKVSPLSTKTLFVEAEDFDFGGGKTQDQATSGFSGPYDGGAYEGLGTADDAEIDFHSSSSEGQTYRPDTAIAAGKGPVGSAGNNRGYFTVKKNWTVGWNDPGEWMNYTRTFPTPAKKYNIYGHLSSGGNPIHGQIDLVTAGVGTDTQTLKYLATVRPGRATAGWDVLEIFQFTDTDKGGAPVVAELGGKVTFRFTTMPDAALDIDYLAFVPADEVVVAPTLSISKTSLTFTGVLQVSDTAAGPYTDVAGATSPRDISGTAGTKFWRTRSP